MLKADVVKGMRVQRTQGHRKGKVATVLDDLPSETREVLVELDDGDRVTWYVENFEPVPPVIRAAQPVAHGGKDDSKKLPMTLLFAGMPNALEGVARVLEGGAKKYAAHSWRKVENGLQRYHDAAARHMHDLNKHGLEHINTEDFGLPTIDHLLCDLLFIRELLVAEGKIK